MLVGRHLCRGFAPADEMWSRFANVLRVSEQNAWTLYLHGWRKRAKAGHLVAWPQLLVVVAHASRVIAMNDHRWFAASPSTSFVILVDYRWSAIDLMRIRKSETYCIIICVVPQTYQEGLQGS